MKGNNFFSKSLHGVVVYPQKVLEEIFVKSKHGTILLEIYTSIEKNLISMSNKINKDLLTPFHAFVIYNVL